MVYHIPAITFKFPESFILFVFQAFLILTKLMVRKALNCLGICKHNPPPLEHHEDAASGSAAALVSVPIASIVPVPAVTILIEAIKKRVPVVKYGVLVNRTGMTTDEIIIDCSICLSSVERCHEIRELSNCIHVFHKDCLDNWVNVGQVTCPLCRSMLLPVDGDRYADLFAVERSSAGAI